MKYKRSIKGKLSRFFPKRFSKGKKMDVFENKDHEFSNKSNQDSFDISQFLGELPGEDTSAPERFLDKTIGTFQRIVTFIIIGVGIISLLILLPPFLRFVWELSESAWDLVGDLFL